IAISDDRETRLDLPEDEMKLLKDLAATTTPESLHVYFQMLLRGEEEIRRSSMPKIALEMLLLRMAQLPKLESIDAVLDRIAMLERSLKEGHGASACVISESRPGFDKNVPSAQPPNSAPPSRPVQAQPGALSRKKPEARKAMPPLSGVTPDLGPAPISPDFTDNYEPLPAPDPEPAVQADFPPEGNQQLSLPASAPKAVEDWPVFVAFLENYNPILWAKVSHCTVKASGESLELEVPDIFEKSANGPEFIQKLGDASLAFFGSRLQWIIVKKPSRTSRAAAAQGSKTGKPSGTKHIVNHPAVQQAIEILGAELIEVKPPKELEPNRFHGGKNNK